MPAPRPFRSSPHHVAQLPNPRSHATALDASPARRALYDSWIRRVARSSAGRHRHPSLSVGAGPRADPRSRIPIPARGRGRARQDDPGWPHVVGVARARMVRTGAYRDARGTSPAVGRGAAAALRDTRDRGGRVSPRGTRRIPALRCESVVGRTGRHNVHRLPEAARSAARGRPSVVGCVDCGRGAPGHSRVAAIRCNQRGRHTRSACAPAHGHSARRRQSRVSSPVRHRTTRQGRPHSALPQDAERDRHTSNQTRASVAGQALGSRHRDASAARRLYRAVVDDCAPIGQPRRAVDRDGFGQARVLERAFACHFARATPCGANGTHRSGAPDCVAAGCR